MLPVAMTMDYEGLFVIPHHDHDLMQGAPSGTMFATSQSWWVDEELFYVFFLQNIPPTRPVLLLYECHAWHMSIKLLKKVVEK